MSRQSRIRAAALLVTAALSAPAALWAGEGQASGPLAVVGAWGPESYPEGFDPDNDAPLVLKSTDAGVTGLKSEDDEGFGARLGHKLVVDLGGADTVGVLMDAGTDLTLAESATIRAETAVRGEGTLYLAEIDWGGAKHFDIAGALDMKKGAIVSDFGSVVSYAGVGEVGAYTLESGSLTVGKAADAGAETFLKIGTLSMGAGTQVTVAGDVRGGDEEIPDGRILVVQNIKTPESETISGNSGPAQVNVTGQGTLVIGTSLAEIGDLSEQRKAVLETVNSAAVVAGTLGKATLVTDASLTLEKGISIVVGEKVAEGKAGTDGVHIGSDGRWIADFSQIDKKADENVTLILAEALGVGAAAVTADQGAELILWNWNGLAFEIGDFAAENVHAFGGARIQIKDGVATRLWCKDFAGLNASSVVARVETAENTDALAALPGYRFLIDSFAEEAVGRYSYANVVDGALFLPVTSGLAAAGERASFDALETVMNHPFELYAGKGHWWVQGRSARTDADSLFSGGSGSFGYRADVTQGTLGYDFAVGGKWIGSASVTFAGIDTESRGRIEQTTGDMSAASFTAAAARRFDAAELRLAVTYTRASGDAEQRSITHRLEADTDIDFVTAAARVTATQFAGGKRFVLPYVQLSASTAKLDDSVITDSTTDGTVAGEAFSTSADRRYWATLQAGFDAGTRFTLAGKYSVAPWAGAAVRTAAGDRDWKITSALFDGSAASEAEYDSAQSAAVRVRAGIEIARSGQKEASAPLFLRSADKDAGPRTEPFAWSLTLSGEYEAAQGSEHTAAVLLTYRQLF